MEKTIFELLPGTKANVPLAPLTTFKIGGKAQYFFAASDPEGIQKALAVARKLELRFFVLAGGSNVLISDKGFGGLVIFIQNSTYRFQGTKLFVDAGIGFPVIVRETGKLGLAGLEWAGGLPGSVGGAVRGNAGAFGGEVKDNIVKVKALDDKGRIRTFSNKQCRFSYRSSVFKEKGWVVLSAVLQLKKEDKKTIQAIANDHKRYRRERHPLEYPNAGSVFKNCDLKLFSKKLQQQLMHVVKVDPFPVVPTAYLISEAGLKGLRHGGVQVSEKHPNYMVNLGNATASDVRALIRKVKSAIKKKFGVALEQEIQYVA